MFDYVVFQMHTSTIFQQLSVFDNTWTIVYAFGCDFDLWLVAYISKTVIGKLIF